MVRIRWFFIRHAESEANVVERWRIAGRSEAARLTERGERQARVVGEAVAIRLEQVLRVDGGDAGGVSGDAGRRRVLAPVAFTSPLLRARQTAALVLEQVAQPVKLEPVDDLAEVYQGLWEDALRSEVHTPETLQAMARNPYEFRAPGGEAQADVERRVLRAVSRMSQRVLSLLSLELEENEQTDVIVLVFTHGYVCKCLIRSVLDASPHLTGQIQVDNGALVELWLEPAAQQGALTSAAELGMWTVLRINDTWGQLTASMR
ncbi:similar to fructose-2,6-bisphosphatase [Cyanidioschyzon merolae strain 10D]|uniref:Similar to fructose-2,6-bisphosphatase n=1 Tax=Cyanidioschyzon merolae (strain NIES-3377 / 10D) TaxID=280699 RepID=M1V507_CYAM1|nr:similar to fructose-2,6-bisphosphatase [Cyanidioschyzon merolae strain 10D]BAM79840.1 similar to fructose-2,6-bisphosphatase [Cyanidioschyzon merolae strain 10D]|eukprot:XP_005536126.1 similar to fructose-2,6-bisphosphatase [Cyanidioschyzon merolae strain 10D]